MGLAELEARHKYEVAYEATVSMAYANVVALISIPLSYVLLWLPYQWFWWGRWSAQPGFESPSLWLLIPLLLLSVVVYEQLHALGFILVGRVPLSSVSFGFQPKMLAAYAHCHTPVTTRAYRAAVLLSRVLLGVVPGLMGVALGWQGLILWAAAMIVAAGGDLAVLLAMRTVPGDALVLDHPSKPGCQVLKLAQPPSD